MAECECLPKCPFFNEKMADMPVTAEHMRTRYCITDNSECARFMVFKALGREKVPPTLFPHNVSIAKTVIAAG